MYHHSPSEYIKSCREVFLKKFNDDFKIPLSEYNVSGFVVFMNDNINFSNQILNQCRNIAKINDFQSILLNELNHVLFCFVFSFFLSFHLSCVFMGGKRDQ